MDQRAENRAASYSVLARKYRPAGFEDLIGQEPMVRTLTNAFRTGRIAQAYMLTGVRGVGKTTTARILARALNYKTSAIDAPTVDMPEDGEHCRAIQEGRHVDVIEMDAASHTGIDDIREIIESAQYAPAIARYKVYIIDEVHMLSRSAFNGLLKTLEEPPPHLKFIFATTEIRKVPVTIQSRCQRFDLRRVDAGLLSDHLRRISAAEGIEADDEALALIARAAEGSVRDALSILDQAIAHGGGRIDAASVQTMLGLADRARVIDLFEQVMKGDIAAALTELKEQYDLGADPAMVLTDLANFVHFVTLLKYVPAAAQDHTLSQIERESGADFAQRLSVRVLSRAWQILLKGIEETQRSEQPLAAADMVLVRLTHASTLPGPEELIRDPGAGEVLPEGASSSSPAPAASAALPSPPSPRREGFGAGSSALKLAAEPAGSSGPEPRAMADFESLILLAEEKRDLKIRTLLRRNVRLVSFADGHLEINLAGDPPTGFLPELSRKLTEWTGRRWTIALSREEGQPTIEEAEQARAGALADMVRVDPTVAAIIERFPGARIVDIRIRGDDNGDIFPADGDIETGLEGN